MLLLFFLVIRKLPTLNQILTLTVISVWIVPLSHDYTLVHLYAPLLLMILLVLRLPPYQPVGRSIFVAFSCFAVLLSDLDFITFHGELYGGQVRCVVLAVLLGLSLKKELFTITTPSRLAQT